MKKQKGFTLIELLVVVAVIAILASVVLVNLRGARDKATDSRIISAMGQVRSSAEILYSANNSYDGVCSSSTSLATTGDLKTLQDEITNNGGTDPKCYLDGTKQDYCFSVKLKSEDTTWCVDGQGHSGKGKACSATGKCS